MPPRLHSATRDLLRRSLPADTLAFAEAVVAQATHGPAAAAGAAGEEEVAARLLGVVRAAAGAGEEEAAALAGDPVLLAALFQNADLLPAGEATADAVASLVLHAVHYLDAAG